LVLLHDLSDASNKEALPQLFELSKKTIIHNPLRMSSETASSKHDQVNAIIDIIGDMHYVKEATIYVR
jgi:hypothetical protein